MTEKMAMLAPRAAVTPRETTTETPRKSLAWNVTHWQERRTNKTGKKTVLAAGLSFDFFSHYDFLNRSLPGQPLSYTYPHSTNS